jgi:hypothetical protein
LPTPKGHPISLNFEVWKSELAGDPDEQYILEGVKNGFHIVDHSARPANAHMANYKSATNPACIPLVEDQIRTEVAEGRYIIVREKPPLISALGAIKKEHSKGVRLIHDCSQPAGHALNDYAPLGEKVSYQSVQDAVDLLTHGGFSAKVDLRSAYRSVKIHPDDWAFTGLTWKFTGHSSETYLIDTRLPFGSRRAPHIFHRLTQAVTRMMARRGFKIVAYLDDFFIHEETFERCQSAIYTLLMLLRRLGFYISYEKMEGPATRVTFLGIDIDSESFTLELNKGKLQQFRDMLLQFAQRKRASLRQLQQLAGRLNWACQVVKGGRTYLRRILDMTRPLQHAHHKVLLPSSFFEDLNWWLQFLHIFNGKCLALTCAPVQHVYIDSSNTGSGFLFNSDWGYIGWQEDFPAGRNLHINDKEIMSAVFAARRWAPYWANSRVCFHTDSTTARAALAKGTAKSPLIMPYLRELFWYSAMYNFTIDARYIPGIANDTPDMISRLSPAGLPSCVY